MYLFNFEGVFLRDSISEMIFRETDFLRYYRAVAFVRIVGSQFRDRHFESLMAASAYDLVDE